jgi:hypothetical protein
MNFAPPQGRREKLVSGGGWPEYLATFFLGRRPTSKIPVRKNFDDFFLVTFHIFSWAPDHPWLQPPTAPLSTPLALPFCTDSTLPPAPPPPLPAPRAAALVAPPFLRYC